MKNNYLITFMLLITFFTTSCEDVIEGHKVIYINFTNAKTGKGIDSICCFIGKPGFPYYRIESATLSDKDGNCFLETDYYANNKSYFVIDEVSDMNFGGNKVFLNRGGNVEDKYRLKENKPYINLGKQNEFKLNFQLIPLTKLIVTCEFKKDFQGYRNYEFFEKGESIYNLSKGSYHINDKDTDICYISSIAETTLLYRMKTSVSDVLYSKSIVIDSVAIKNKTLHIVFD